MADLAGTQITQRSTAAVARRPGSRPGRSWRHRVGRALTPLLWVGPAIVLIAGVVIWPAIAMIRTSFTKVSFTGLLQGSAGFDNYRQLFANPALVHVLIDTAIWVAGVVLLTLAISMALAQLLNQQFPGRRLVRWAVVVPWAASVVMTAVVWRWMLSYFYGIINRIFTDLHILNKPIDWLGEPKLAFAWMMGVAIFVSLPFTIYVILAGLQTIPGDVYEAAKMDGASAWRTYWSVVVPLLKPALLIGSVINMINVFNSFPIIWTMTQGGPGNATDTMTTFMYKLAFQNQEIGVSGAMAVLNFVLIIVLVLMYLRLTRWKEA